MVGESVAHEGDVWSGSLRMDLYQGPEESNQTHTLTDFNGRHRCSVCCKASDPAEKIIFDVRMRISYHTRAHFVSTEHALWSDMKSRVKNKSDHGIQLYYVKMFAVESMHYNIPFYSSWL